MSTPRDNESGESVLGVIGGIAIAVVAILVVVLLAIGAWKLDWFVQEKNTDRQVNIDNRNTGTQTAWHDQVKQGIRDYELLDETDAARRGAIRNQVCDIIPRLTDPYLDATIVEFNQQEC